MSAERKGYSGTALYTKKTCLGTNMGVSEFDSEGRTLVLNIRILLLLTATFQIHRMKEPGLIIRLIITELFINLQILYRVMAKM